MKHMKTLTSLVLAFCLVFGLAACGSQTAAPTTAATEAVAETVTEPAAESTAAESHYPVTVTNFNYAGEEISHTYEKAPERVIAIYQNCVETMIALGLEDHVIASFGLDNPVKPEWEEGFAKMHYDDSVFRPDKETVTMLNPDMIFSWGSIFDEKKLGDIPAWNDKGVATFMSTNSVIGRPRQLENEYTDILNIGKIFDVEDKAEAMVNEMKAAIDETIAKTQGQEAPRAVIIQNRSDGSIRNFPATTLPGDMIIHLGGTLIKAEGEDISKEELVALDPDVFFVTHMAYRSDDPEAALKAELEKITEDPALASLSAVKNGRVIPILLDEVYASGPRTLDGIVHLTEGMYPDLSK